MAKHGRDSGRVTPSKRTLATREHDQPSTPQASARYTPKQAAYRVRPGWHRIAGWVGVALGILIVAINDLMLMTSHLTVLPGGHNELYLLVGLGVAGGATWFLGLFDRGTTVYD